MSSAVEPSSVLDLQKFPQGTLQVYGAPGGDAPTGLTANIEISNVQDGAWVVFATCTHANLGSIAGPAPGGAGGFVLLPVGPRYVRLNVTALATGKVACVINIPSQS